MDNSVVRRAAALLSVTQVGNAGIGFITTLIATRSLGANGFGAAAALISVPALFWTLASLKPAPITTRLLMQSNSDEQNGIRAAVVRASVLLDLGSAFLVIIATIGLLVATDVIDRALQPALLVLSFSYLPLAFSGTSFAVLQTNGRFKSIAIIEVVERLTVLLATVFLITGRQGPSAVVYGLAAGNVVLGTICASLVMRYYARWRRLGQGILEMPPAWGRELRASLGWNYVLVSLSGIASNVPVLLIARFGSVDSAGFFRLGLSLFTIATYAESALSRVVYPKLCLIASAPGAIAGSQYTPKRMFMSMGLPGAMAIVVVAAFVPILVPLAFGAEFSAAVFGIQCMFVAAAIATALFWQAPMYLAFDQMRSIAALSTIHTILLVAVVVPAVVTWGFGGVAAAFLLTRIWYAASLAVYSPARRVQDLVPDGIRIGKLMKSQKE